MKEEEKEENIVERNKVGWEEAADFLLLHSGEKRQDKSERKRKKETVSKILEGIVSLKHSTRTGPRLHHITQVNQTIVVSINCSLN